MTNSSRQVLVRPFTSDETAELELRLPHTRHAVGKGPR
jgi:hypothetical protein